MKVIRLSTFLIVLLWCKNFALLASSSCLKERLNHILVKEERLHYKPRQEDIDGLGPFAKSVVDKLTPEERKRFLEMELGGKLDKVVPCL